MIEDSILINAYIRDINLSTVFEMKKFIREPLLTGLSNSEFSCLENTTQKRGVFPS